MELIFCEYCACDITDELVDLWERALCDGKTKGIALDKDARVAVVICHCGGVLEFTILTQCSWRNWVNDQPRISALASTLPRHNVPPYDDIVSRFQ